MKRISIITGSLCLLFITACKEDQFTKKSGPLNTVSDIAPDNVSMKILKNANTDIKIGAAVNVNYLKVVGSDYRETVKLHYNCLTAENTMKMDKLNPTKYDWEFEGDNAIIPQFAIDFNYDRLHGHTLVWHRALPGHVSALWTSSASTTQKRDTLRNMMKRHINKTIDYYSQNFKENGVPIVKSWDVVNEAFNDDGTLRVGASGLEASSIWANYIGESYIEEAYRLAKKAAVRNNNAGLLLFYNDYGHDYSVSKRNAIFDKVVELKNKSEIINGVSYPLIDGVAMQMHIRYNTSKQSVIDAITKMKQTGLKVFISELDISLRSFTEEENKVVLTSTQITQRELLQKQLYKDVVDAYTDIVPPNQRWGITLWNVGDSDSNLTPESYATLYRAGDYLRKNSFYYFYEGLRIRQ